MATCIHPTAIIDGTAELADGVEVGPYAVVGPRVKIGENTILRAHCQVVADAQIGKRCDIHPGAVIGGDPQDLKFRGEQTLTILGDDNTVRECVTINRGTGLGGGKTAIGNGNLIMAYVHIAHDCIIGNQCILTNCAQLAGHIKVEDMAIISGMVAIHHFVTIGSQSFIAGLSAVRTDVPPYMIAEGNPARVRKLNSEGLRRRNVSSESVEALKALFKAVYRSDMTREEAIQYIEETEHGCDVCVQNVIGHFRASEQGCQGRALEAFRQDKKAAAASNG